MPNVDIAIRQALPKDARDAVCLFFLSAPFFGDILGGETKSQKIFTYLFQRRGNLFSFEHAYFAEKEGIVTGMALGYEWSQRQKEGLRTGLLLLRQSGFHLLYHLRFWQNLSTVTRMLHPQGYYLSNLAIYPTSQGQGIGKQLLFFIEDVAFKKNCRCVELDVSADNPKAVNFYCRLGYQAIRESRFSHQGGTLTLLRMRKLLE